MLTTLQPKLTAGAGAADGVATFRWWRPGRYWMMVLVAVTVTVMVTWDRGCCAAAFDAVTRPHPARTAVAGARVLNWVFRETPLNWWHPTMYFRV